jgi:hypothetical protein
VKRTTRLGSSAAASLVFAAAFGQSAPASAQMINKNPLRG